MRGEKTALVLGATGGIGGEVTAALLRHGWTVRAMARNPEDARGEAPVALADATWVSGDAMIEADVRRASRSVQAIIHAVNPPGYRNWAGTVLPMIDNTIAAARETGARIVLPGTVYNYGPDAFPNLTEEAPQTPQTSKGRIRAELERRLESESRAGAPALIVRFGDFFGPNARNNWFSMGLVKPGKRLDAITNPGKPGIGHAWSYLPDAGETIASLLDRSDKLQPFDRFHFSGTWDADGLEMARGIARAVGRPDTRIKALPWSLIRLAGLFQETPREIYETRYLWRTPVKLDNSRLVACLGKEPHTPLPEALRTTLASLRIS